MKFCLAVHLLGDLWLAAACQAAHVPHASRRQSLLVLEVCCSEGLLSGGCSQCGFHCLFSRTRCTAHPAGAEEEVAVAQGFVEVPVVSLRCSGCED